MKSRLDFSYHRVRGLYFLAVVFVANTVTPVSLQGQYSKSKKQKECTKCEKGKVCDGSTITPCREVPTFMT